MNDTYVSDGEKYRQLFESSPLALFVLDRHGKVFLANPAASRLLGGAPEGMAGLDLTSRMAPGNREAFLAHLAAVFEARGPITGEVTLIQGNGQDAPAEADSRFLPGWEPGPACLTALTGLAGRLRQVREAREAADRANQAKSAFLATMSHEIRTPMNAILGMTRLLKENALSPEQLDLLSDVENAGVTLLGIVNDILDFSRIEAGRYELNLEPVDLWEVLGSSLRTQTVAGGNRQLRPELDIRPDTPRRIVTDPRLLSQILGNLMSNAVKFTRAGAVSMKAWPTPGLKNDPEGRESVVLNVAVADTGIGIPESKLEEIFDPFSQAEPTITRVHGGTGLGLAICKRLADLLGGTILVESTPGKGSTFTLTFPAAIPAASPSPAPAAASRPSGGDEQPRLKILLAEDNELNKRLAQKFLGYRGHTVTPVSNGREALEALSRERFDMILMDVSMPIMDGLDATKAVRAHDGSAFDPRIPIIAVTAHAVEGDRERFLAAGMDAYISKPLDLEQFERVILDVALQAMRSASAAQAGRRAAAAPGGEEEPFDTSLQAQRFASMQDFLPELLALYRKNAVVSLDKLRASVEDGDIQAAYKEAHTLKGMASVVCATVVQRLAGQMEGAGKQGDIQAVRALLAELEVQVERSLVNGNHTRP